MPRDYVDAEWVDRRRSRRDERDGEQVEVKFRPAEWHRPTESVEAVPRRRPYSWPVAREPLYDGDDAMYGPYGYQRDRRRGISFPEGDDLGPFAPDDDVTETEIQIGRHRLREMERRYRRARSMGKHFHLGQGPKGYRRSDERIYEDIAERLMEDPFVDPSDVEVKVEKGEVTLTGTVSERRMKHEVEDIADTVLGVEDIHNELRVRRSDTDG